MNEKQNWDWQKGKHVVADLAQIRTMFPRVDEFTVSPDGRRIAAPIKKEDDSFTVFVDGEAWPESFELCWNIRFSPFGKLIALVRIDDEWTLAAEGVPWEQRFEYAWNPIFSADGRVVAVSYKRDNKYGVSIEGKVWEEGFIGMRDVSLSSDGAKAAATVQVVPLDEADVPGFFKGTWSLAVDGKTWGQKFINTWNPIFDARGEKVAAEVRTGICEYHRDGG